MIVDEDPFIRTEFQSAGESAAEDDFIATRLIHFSEPDQVIKNSSLVTPEAGFSLPKSKLITGSVSLLGVYPSPTSSLQSSLLQHLVLLVSSRFLGSVRIDLQCSV